MKGTIAEMSSCQNDQLVKCQVDKNNTLQKDQHLK